MSNNIEIIKVNIDELLKKANNSIIPYYQREYNWGEQEIERLFYDLFSNKSKEYYCGQIIINSNLTAKKIVDGQQRISTFLLIAKYLNFYIQKNNIDLNLINILNYDIKSNNLIDKEILKKIVETNDENELLQVCEKYNKSKYVINYKYIYNYFKNKNENELIKFISLFRNVIFSLVVTNIEYDEFRLFTNINSTGLPLNAFDLIKNFLFSKMEIVEKEINQKLEILENITSYLYIDKNNNQLDNDKKAKNLNEFVRYFIAYKNGDLDKCEPTMLYRTFENIYEKNYHNNVLELFNDFIKFGVYFKFIKTELLNKKYNFYKSMRIINIQFNTFITLLINILENNSNYSEYYLKMEINDEQQMSIERTLLIIESYILFRTYTNMRSNDLTRFIPSLNEKINSYINKGYTYSASLFKILYFDQINTEVNTKMPSKKVFFNELMNKSDIYTSKKKFTAQLLIRIDEFINEEYNRKNTSQYEKVEIEHIMPQNYGKWLKENEYLNEEDAAYYVNSLGNLTILSSKLNNEIKDNVFSIKKEKLLEKGTYIINNYLNQLSYWDIDSIRERTEYLCEQINKIYDFDNLFIELGEKEENINISFTKQKNIEKILDVEKCYNTIKSRSKKYNIIIDYNKICEAIHQFCIENISIAEISRNIFKEPQESKVWFTHSILRALGLDTSCNSIHKNKDKEWVNNFINSNQEIIQSIINCSSN